MEAHICGQHCTLGPPAWAGRRIANCFVLYAKQRCCMHVLRLGNLDARMCGPLHPKDRCRNLVIRMQSSGCCTCTKHKHMLRAVLSKFAFFRIRLLAGVVTCSFDRFDDLTHGRLGVNVLFHESQISVCLVLHIESPHLNDAVGQASLEAAVGAPGVHGVRIPHRRQPLRFFQRNRMRKGGFPFVWH